MILYKALEFCLYFLNCLTEITKFSPQKKQLTFIHLMKLVRTVKTKHKKQGGSQFNLVIWFFPAKDL